MASIRRLPINNAHINTRRAAEAVGAGNINKAVVLPAARSSSVCRPPARSFVVLQSSLSSSPNLLVRRPPNHLLVCRPSTCPFVAQPPTHSSSIHPLIRRPFTYSLVVFQPTHLFPSHLLDCRPPTCTFFAHPLARSSWPGRK